MTQDESSIVLRYFVKSCKVRRLCTVLGSLVGLFLFVRIVRHRYLDDKTAGEYGNGVGAKRSPRDMPGYFMVGRYPSENSSYCNFNYGLPDALDWSRISVLGSPQLGRKSPYRVVYDAIERTSYNTHLGEHVTYATHVTPEFLYHIVEIARYWDGPISVAAFVPDYDLEITMKLFSHLCRCYEGMSKVSLHLVFPQQDRPRFSKDERVSVKRRRRIKGVLNTNSTKEAIKKTNETQDLKSNVSFKLHIDIKKPNINAMLAMNIRRSRLFSLMFHDCSMPDMSESISYRTRHGLVYPVNVARNVARNASKTQYIMVSDVEMIPSEDLATRFMDLIKRHKINGRYGIIPKWRLAFVVPVFEVESGEDVPRNKSSLQQLYIEGKAVYFHRWVCAHCQKIPDLPNWIKEDPGRIIKPFAITKRQFPYHRWEPIYISTKHTPLYSETLSWEGRQDKMTQMLEMCLKSYDFVILNGAFLCHSPGIKIKSKHKSWRHRHELSNIKQYDLIVKSLAERYPVNPKCRLE